MIDKNLQPAVRTTWADVFASMSGEIGFALICAAIGFACWLGK